MVFEGPVFFNVWLIITLSDFYQCWCIFSAQAVQNTKMRTASSIVLTCNGLAPSGRWAKYGKHLLSINLSQHTEYHVTNNATSCNIHQSIKIPFFISRLTKSVLHCFTISACARWSVRKAAMNRPSSASAWWRLCIVDICDWDAMNLWVYGRNWICNMWIFWQLYKGNIQKCIGNMLGHLSIWL